ncbi:carboxypeptidase regulatory-like domain-containing protein [bacterium]|nr:carboxypeptidase regulatory-like domain-containing protein [bacterium]
MVRLKTITAAVLSLTIVVLLNGLLKAQNSVDPNVDVLVTPAEAEIEVGDDLKLDILAYTLASDRKPARFDAIEWEVTPDSMGTITDDGFFLAGKHEGKVVIIARIRIGDRIIERRVVIVIRARRPHLFVDLEVVPARAVVPSSGEQQFEVVLKLRGGIRTKPDHVRWEVVPEDLGTISQDGLFTAGAEQRHGKVVAHADIDGVVLRAAAKVAISAPATGAIAGVVTDDNTGNGIEGAKVKAVRLGRIDWVGMSETDVDGNYLIGDLIPGVYVVYANASGFVGEFFEDTRNFFEATPQNIAENDTAEAVDFGLSQGGVISGTVTEADGAAIGDAHVVAFLVVNPRFARHARSDENGDYAIDSLPDGTYAVKANAEGYVGELFDNARSLDNATFLTVQEAATIDTVDFEFDAASAISGVVLADNDEMTPIAGAHVVVYLAKPNSTHDAISALHRRSIRETRTDENGQYIVQLRPGFYQVFAFARGFSGEFFDNKQYAREADLVQVLEGAHTSNIDFKLGTRGSIAGQVTDQETGEPIVGAIVEAFKEKARVNDEARHAGFRAKTDDLGNYLIEDVPDGKYLMVALAREYLPEFYRESPDKEHATFILMEAGEDTTGVDFTLEKGGSIAGFVGSNPDSLPLARSLVQVWNTENKVGRKTYTDDSGQYKVEGLPTGDYIVHVIARGFHPEFYEDARHRRDATRVAVVSPNESSPVDLYLDPISRQRGTLAGRVISDADDAPIQAAVVIAVSLNNRRPFITFSGPFGFYELTDVPEGRYIVFAWAPGFVGEFFKDAHRVKDAERVLVESDQVTNGIDFGLRPQHQIGVYAIRGRIRDASTGAPLEGVSVFAKVDGQDQVNAVTDPDGKYVMQGLPAGTYQVEASGAGFNDAQFGGAGEGGGADVTIGSGADAGDIDLDLEPESVTSIDSGDELMSTPETFDLAQNYPNPFNPETTIKYQLGQASRVSLKIFNVLGQEIRDLVNEELLAGNHTAVWDGRDNFGRQVASGVYLFRITAGDFRMSRRMLLLK